MALSSAVAQTPREELARTVAPVLREPPATGLLIFEVVPGSQCAKAGLQVGDIITHYDGQPVKTVADLSQLARAAAKEKRAGLLLLARRGDQELDTEVDAAPLGVRLIGVEQGRGRTLWRAQTPYEPDLQAITQLLNQQHRWELLVQEDKPVGWLHYYLTRQGDRLVLRLQSRLQDDRLNEKRDVIVSFVADRYLSVRSIRLVSQESLVLDLQAHGRKLEGERAGVPVSAVLPADAISSYLAPLAVTMMPMQAEACLHCSYLESGSLWAAPFADLYCHGKVELQLEDKSVPAWRYEQTVFGETVANYWLDAERNLVQVMYGPTICGVSASMQQVLRAFPNATEGFQPIERLPSLPQAVQAN